MQTIFNQFKEQFYNKSLNEILGCAKFHRCNLSLIKDVDEYNDNEFACIVEWYPNDKHNSNERIEVECSYSDMSDSVRLKLLPKEVTKFNRTWEVVRKLDLNSTDNGDTPIWWKVLEMDSGTLFMNNYDGEMAFVEINGRILKTLF